jgi:NAD(P)H-quinone oxidoreductase subunit 5
MRNHQAGRTEWALLALLGGITGLSALLLMGQAVTPQAIHLPGVTIDRLSAVMSLLVAGIGTVVYRFTLRYLDGEPGHRRFLRWLFFTIGAAYLLMLASNLLLLFLAWLLTSLGLHQLLTFYYSRRAAHPPARKKFLISRLGDVVLLSAIGLIGLRWQTLDLHVFLERIAVPGTPAVETIAVALLVVVAALTKSAQVPFHSWLPETMEAPTPVSALMHAGIINAGGVLLLRFAPLLVRVPEALFLLALVGTLTAVLGALAMWAQVNVKRSLAWSTVSQMGFMMVQCGLAAFPAAALHLVGHGCYKAWSFLRAGDLPKHATLAPPSAPLTTLARGALGTAVALPALALAATVTGFDPLHSPGELALAVIVALTIGQLWIVWLRNQAPDTNSRFVGAAVALVLTVVACIAAFALYQGAALFFAPVLGDLPMPSGPLAWAAALLPIVAFVSLATVYALLPLIERTALGRAFRIHALHGFYLGALADRLVDQVWNRFETQEVTHA